MRYTIKTGARRGVAVKAAMAAGAAVLTAGTMMPTAPPASARRLLCLHPERSGQAAVG